ncbi:unnamed protein product [Nyctereutes procyonoides]|uniref:(raccoon dog) hypothetical protein n=1 Tax=Nyctereutes procyonoides TaxID=34880 RepID=A0A811ZSR0_NYCPR|nr:unnamed protein product [Nyctereutes procyonoides]
MSSQIFKFSLSGVWIDLLCQWVQLPSVSVPSICCHALRPSGVTIKVSTSLQVTAKAAIPSSGPLMALHDYYWHHLDSTSNNSHLSLPSLSKAHWGHWWASSFLEKSTFPFMAKCWSLQTFGTFPGHQQHSHLFLLLEAMRRHPGGLPGKANTGPQS